MYAIIDFFTSIFSGIVDILNTRFFADVPITFLEVFLCGILLKFVIKFVFGGLKEIDTSTNSLNYGVIYNARNKNRKSQVLDIFSGNYMVKHSHYGEYTDYTITKYYNE